MIVLMLLLAGQAADADAMMKGAGARLSVPCGEACVAPSPDLRYRIDTEEPAGLDPKDRALADKAGRCAVVGDRICTRPPRRLWSAPLRR